MFLTTQIAKGVSLHIRQTAQFKTVNFSIKWRAPLNEKAASERTVLTNVLQHSNEKFPTSAAFRSYLDDLFGTVLYFDTTKRGQEHTVLLNVETVNDQYLSHGNVLNEVISLLQQAIFKPNFENGVFKEAIVEREKEMVIQRIQSIFDDKSRYAQKRLMEIMRPNDAASISANGTIEAVKAITPASLTKTYENMLANDLIDIYVVGDVDTEKITAQLQEALSFTDRKQHEWNVSKDASNEIAPYTKETQEMKQGKLHIGYNAHVRFGDADFAKMQIFNGIFGGYAHSKLFMNVREKESLAYYASSSYSSYYGLLFVVSGIEPANEQKARELIAEQLTAIQNGEISDLELAQTKAMLINQLKEALDSSRGQIEIFDQYKTLEEPFTLDTWATRWQEVTKEDVQQMAKLIELEATYFLCGKEDESRENN
ncbi:insulinase family protein [Lysinibacillus sp. 2017]|uniref:EF-P 5-aminopentanol modification-associated protein YfmF n=1 Tax=unclassified Lysinibacillus TaxID=2636778 RepID=UPI000D529BF1|nr:MULTISPECIES: pitrilysin family protein [unclassified Lysinibacillus]AWE06739.1 insulinase family protein [Lysinibacillus sp. 2017]TGN37329.1 insulinase family protein [Lysinibacillus sp. S2017]